MSWSWTSVALTDGSVIADLAGLEPTYPLRSTLMGAETATAVLNLTDSTPENWPDATLEGGAFLVCYDADDAAQPIVWGGYVVQADEDDTDQVKLSLATFEACLDREPCGDVLYGDTWHRDDILANLVHRFTADSGIAVTVDWSAGGGPTPDDGEQIVFQNTDNASYKARMDQVCAQFGGEYNVTLAWSDDMTTVVITVVIADQIGAVTPDGLEPLVTFEMPGQIVTFNRTRSYDPGKAGNKVVAYSSGAADVTNFSTPVLGPVDGRPTWEFRFQPANAPISPAGLNRAAKAAAKVIVPGARPTTIVVSRARDTGRRLGVDWGMGDEIGYVIPSSYVDETGATVKVRAFPDGLEGTGRVVAYELSLDTVAPVFADTATYQ